MPSLPRRTPASPLEPLVTPAVHATDWPLIYILLTVFIILSLEFALAITWIRIHNLRSKARWRSLRERGVIIVSGAAMVWAQDLPSRRGGISRMNLHDARRDRGK
ncbi:hypothetical protein BDU57DRAFT_459278 [Ampelomyces quisqualis]|uniref:Uncharacterized protein n=1 Tax=Ampelomyces quisqualis TaxID=50730 RepID=A0A6A5QCE8_AMPQU|nr:hypothetical protein BDU57DRAFT_459278 [Ampelomyces quisqualis]